MDSKCKYEDCKDEKIAFSDFCWEHTENKEEYIKKIVSETHKGTSFKGFNFSKAVLKNLDLSKADFSFANLTRSDLSGSNLFDTNLKNAEMLGANLYGSDLTSANLERADLTKASLSGSRLWHTNLTRANLIEADLSSADFWNAKLYKVRLWHTDLTDVSSLGRQNFSHKKNRFITDYKIDEKGLLSAEEAYRNLKRLFLLKGKYNDASWASFKEKNMERLFLRKKKDPAYIPSLIMNVSCGYGEKPYRIILSSFFVIGFYTMVYYITNAIRFVYLESYNLTLADYIYYSTITFTTVGYGDFIPKTVSLFRLIAASEAFIGTFMIGLFIFTLARKYSAR